MRKVSSQFLDLFRDSRLVVTRIDLYSGHKLVKKDIKIVSGSVSADRKANARRTFNAVVALSPWDDLPVNHYESRVQIWTGIEVLPGEPQLVSVGVFRVDTISRSDRGQLSISGTSLEIYVIDDRFFQPRTPPRGAGTIDTIRALISESLPDAQFLVTATKDKPVQMTAPWERERWEAVTALAESIDAEVYCGADGDICIADKPNFILVGADAVWAVNEGPRGVLVTETVSATRERVYNAVVVTQSNTDENTTPAWAVAKDENPTSKTYWEGPFGHVPRFYANPGLTTNARCLEVAQSMVAEAAAENRTVGFSMVPNPALEPGDIVRVSMLDGTVENHMIVSMSMPLGFGEWTATTLASKDTETVEI